MPWDDDLLKEQRDAASHTGTHARLLAGPGTGKTLTLTRRISYLIDVMGHAPDTVLAITFTRAAAGELRQRVADVLGSDRSPRISTLHSFALRQLLKNGNSITELPQPLRIADDWEERNVVLPDLKALCKFSSVRDAQELLNQLSADWQSLTADEDDWDKSFPDPAFLGAWEEHRRIFGYTLRSELVYQLKKALEQRGDFELESPIEHLLVDEYQDLNRCDLAVVNHIASRGLEIFAAGDDDQSIYGFRKADPEGIRRFPDDYPGAADLGLEVCKRCDKAILDLGLFVARQDPRRIDKAIEVESESSEGEVALLRYSDQFSEANGIASLCVSLMQVHELRAEEILILLRSDHNGAFSNAIREKLEEVNIAVATPDVQGPLDGKQGRAFVALLRLAADKLDSLAWRTLLQVWCQGVGEKAVRAVYELARSRGESFAQTMLAANADRSILPTTHRKRLSRAIVQVLDQLKEINPSDEPYESPGELIHLVESAAVRVILDDDDRDLVVSSLRLNANSLEEFSLQELLRTLGTVGESTEQEIEDGKVNILTMHRAKGLSADAVIVAASEDQYIPGRAVGGDIDDERRLLFVSLTRARHHLFVTYCDKRTGRQMHTGRDGGRAYRSLSRFLANGPHSPKDGLAFAREYAERASK